MQDQANTERQRRDYDLLHTCTDCGNEYTCTHALTAHRAEIHHHYEPALCLSLTTGPTKRLRVILAADGTTLAATDEDLRTLPRWVLALPEVGPVHVNATEWRTWYRATPALDGAQ